MKFYTLVSMDSGNGLSPDNSLPEPMLTKHQRGPVAFSLGQFHRNAQEINHKMVFENYTYNYSHISQDAMGYIPCATHQVEVSMEFNPPNFQRKSTRFVHIYQQNSSNCLFYKLVVTKSHHLLNSIYVHVLNPLAPGIFEWNFRYLILQIISVIDGWGISCELALRWMSLDLIDDKSTLVQVMA